MRFLLCTLPLLAACGASSGGNFDITLKGHGADGSAVDIHVVANDDGAGPANSAFTDDDNRDIAPGLDVAGEIEGTSQVSGPHCLSSPCPLKGVISVLTPPPIIYAGPWKGAQASVAFEDELNTVMNGFDFSAPGNDFALNYDPPEYHGSGDVTIVQHGTVTGTFTSRGAAVTVAGKFSTATPCNIQNPNFRNCGEPRGEDGKSNPIQRPYTENTCPADLVAPYEASPTWTNHTLHLGSIAIDCRTTDGPQPEAALANLLCYRRTSTSAGGCQWDVHFLADGQLEQFAVAAFASSSCSLPVKTCNTYR